MNANVIRALSPEDALIVLSRLNARDGEIAAAIASEVEAYLAEIDAEVVADDVFDELDCIDVDYGLRHAGRKPYGYVEPIEAAAETVEEVLLPYIERTLRYLDAGVLPDAADVYVRGIVLGAYRFDQESTSDFRQWADDVTVESVGYLLDRWRTKDVDATRLSRMSEFIRLNCPAWSSFGL